LLNCGDEVGGVRAHGGELKHPGSNNIRPARVPRGATGQHVLNSIGDAIIVAAWIAISDIDLPVLVYIDGNSGLLST